MSCQLQKDPSTYDALAAPTLSTDIVHVACMIDSERGGGGGAKYRWMTMELRKKKKQNNGPQLVRGAVQTEPPR